MDTLRDIVKQEVCWYASGGVNVRSVAALDDVNQVYIVTSISYPIRRQPAGVVVIARIEGDFVIIEEDRTDRPLYKHLMQAGISREKIILAYSGENIPEPVQA